ncbi:MAG TPA: helix-turn-helix transcriptional regulator [Pyrinomonadaceae bacterium]|jgi:transcriptional regulator with XRE-family HTH domain|nr:helix-turn-helix transcriptional regulator [Pyrinomonadaceae bacterium]
MGKGIRPKPERLAEKLRQIRFAFGLSQTEMLKRLGVEDLITYHRISDYELGKNEPPLTILLQYARVVNVSTDVLIDDELDLPAKLPARRK